MITNIQYDFTGLNRFFNEERTPEAMKEDIITLVFNYIDTYMMLTGELLRMI